MKIEQYQYTKMEQKHQMYLNVTNIIFNYLARIFIRKKKKKSGYTDELIEQ